MQTFKKLTRGLLICLKNPIKRIFHVFPFVERLFRSLAKQFPELVWIYLRLTSPPRRKPVLTAKATKIFDDLKAATALPKRKAYLSLRRGRSL